MTVTAYKAGGGSNIFTLVLAPQGTAILRGDTNGDGTTTLADGILSLQVVSGNQANTLNLNGDIDGNGKIGLEEVLFVLQTLSDQ